MASRFTVNRELVIRTFFFTTFAFLLYQLFLLSRPFLTAILVAGMLSITFYPIYVRVRKYVRNPNLAAFLVTSGVVLAGALPLLAIGWFVFHESDRLIPTVQGVLENVHSGEFLPARESLPSFLQPLVEKAYGFFDTVQVDPRQMVIANLESIGQGLGAWGTMIAKNALFTVFKIFVLLMAMFFTFRDGEKLLRWFLNLIPMESGHKEDLALSAYETFRAVTIGVFLTAAAQGCTAFIGFLIAGVRLPLFLGIATFITSLLGISSLVTIPVGLFVMRSNTTAGVFLLIWGAVVVGLLDNWLRPVLIGSRARMPFFLVFFSILGGIKMYGILGLILGPILVASVLTFIKIYREAYSTDERDA